jgi:predicted dehydrogenase
MCIGDSVEIARVNIGLVGYGYWGPNLARNFTTQTNCELIAICEREVERAAIARNHYRTALITDNYDDLLNNNAIHAILIATPVSSHYDLAKRALLAGKDVLVEKPLTQTVTEASELVRIAEENQRILAVDHTFLFTGAIQKIKEIIESGKLGRIMYIDSIRINLGLFQHDVNVIYDLAPHDFSITNYLVDKDPIFVQAMGISHAGNDIENMAYLHVEYPGDLIAHFHVNWLAPVKIRRMLIGGTEQMIVYDDMEPSEKVKVYDKGIVVTEGDINSIYKVIVDYRTGDMVAPKLAHGEALSKEAKHFLSCVKHRTKPIADGMAGLRVVKMLQAAQLSIRNNGRRVMFEEL